MGIINTTAYLVFGGIIFYGGMCYERKHAEREIMNLKVEMSKLDSIDYKIGSLLEQRVKNPKEVDAVLKKYESLVR